MGISIHTQVLCIGSPTHVAMFINTKPARCTYIQKPKQGYTVNLKISIPLGKRKSCSGGTQTHDIRTAYEAGALPTELPRQLSQNQGSTQREEGEGGVEGGGVMVVSTQWGSL